jgi:PAS domain-containing protein
MPESLAKKPEDLGLRSLLKEAPAILFAIARDGTLLFCVGGADEEEKRQTDSLAGKSIYDLLPRENWALEAVQEVFTTARKNTIFMDFGRRWYEIQLSPIRDESGTVTRVFGIAIDETAKKNNQLLREQQASADPGC